MFHIGLFGVGRIGVHHAGNIASHQNCKLVAIADPHQEVARTQAAIYGAEVRTADAIFGDDQIDAVLIASSTDTHASRIAAGEIGDLELLTIVSKDQAPPTLEYIKVSGGLFRDMTIHDLDMARFLLGEEPIVVSATASCQVDPGIGELGDVDTAVVSLRTAGGKLVVIINSRRAVYGYDQRIEAHGSNGMLSVPNQFESNLVRADADGVTGSKLRHWRPSCWQRPQSSRSPRAGKSNWVHPQTEGRES
jgi:myo-inositol 2-dehydrogenase/D-chiro-inositol 1-dehydrogenase